MLFRSGICGTFMGGVAAIAREAGYRVTGCDAAVYPPMSDQLRRLGIDLVEGYGVDQLSLAPDVWVVGNVVVTGRDSSQHYIRTQPPERRIGNPERRVDDSGEWPDFQIS